MSLLDYYKRATLYPSITVFIGVTIYAVIDNYGYKSEWMTAGTVTLLLIFSVFIYCLILNFLSLTIFLNKYKRVKENPVFNFLSWFFLPFGWIISVIFHEIHFIIEYWEKPSGDFVYVLVLNIPFVFGLIWSYRRFIVDGYSR